MEVKIITPTVTRVKVQEVPGGEVFVFAGEAYIKVKDTKVGVVRLRDGKRTSFLLDTVVDTAMASVEVEVV